MWKIFKSMHEEFSNILCKYQRKHLDIHLRNNFQNGIQTYSGTLKKAVNWIKIFKQNSPMCFWRVNSYSLWNLCKILQFFLQFMSLWRTNDIFWMQFVSGIKLYKLRIVGGHPILSCKHCGKWTKYSSLKTLIPIHAYKKTKQNWGKHASQELSISL